MHLEYCCIDTAIDFILRKANYTSDSVVIHVSYRVMGENRDQFLNAWAQNAFFTIVANYVLRYLRIPYYA